MAPNIQLLTLDSKPTSSSCHTFWFEKAVFISDTRTWNREVEHPGLHTFLGLYLFFVFSHISSDPGCLQWSRMFPWNNNMNCTTYIALLYICETSVLERRLWWTYYMKRINMVPQTNVKEKVRRLTSLRGSPCDICCCSSLCSSFRAPIDCWFLTKSESSLSPASVKYLAKCSQLRLFAGNNSWKKAYRSTPWVEQAFIRRLSAFIFWRMGCHNHLELH